MLKLLKATGIAVFFIFALLSLNFLQAQEEITITTYYPSPYGVYREMRAQRMAIGDNYIRGGDYDWGDEIDNNADLVVEGNVGIGTTSPQAKLDVSGDGDTIIVPRKSTAGDPSGINGMVYYNTSSNKLRVYENGGWKDLVGGGGFGSWTNGDSVNNVLVRDIVYRATSDGFIIAWRIASNPIFIKTDSGNPPSVVRCKQTGWIANDPDKGASCTVPIKKDDYWKVEAVGAGAVTIYWLPIGSGTCVGQ